MKTPREILFGRHRAVEPKLDDVRREAVNQLSLETVPAVSHEHWFVRAFRQLVWPHPRAWAVLGAAWVLILGLHLFARDESKVAVRVAARPSPTAQIVLKQQQQLRAELIGQLPTPDTDRPGRFLRPRSDRGGGLRLA
jgi:hypothetical protein